MGTGTFDTMQTTLTIDTQFYTRVLFSLNLFLCPLSSPIVLCLEPLYSALLTCS